MQTLLLLLPFFLLVFCRITAFLVVAPLFSFRSLPATFKIGIGAFISLLVATALGGDPQPIALDGTYVLMIVREIVIGLLLGYVAYLFFAVVQISGSFVDMQMGFGIVNVMDPMTGAQSPILGNFKFFIALLLFLAINGHHYMLLAIMRSYEWAPLDNSLFLAIAQGHISSFLIDTFVSIFYLAFQMAAPLIATLFLVDVGLGVLARTVPQFNVFVIGLPIKIMVGFLVLLLIVPGLLYLFQELFATMMDTIHRLLQTVANV